MIQIEALLIPPAEMTVQQLVERLNEDVDEAGQLVKGDSVRHALRRGSRSSPPRFACSGSGKDARWYL